MIENYFVATFIQYFLFLIFAFVIFYYVGTILFYSLKIRISDLYTKTFAKIVIGLIIFVMITSIYFTNGITVSWGFVIIAAAWLILYFNTEKERIIPEILTKHNSKVYMVSFSEILLVSLIMFTVNFSIIYNSSGMPNMPSLDNATYAYLTKFLVETGKENATHNFLYATDTGVSAYHYFELWLNAGIFSIFHLNPLLTLLLITYSIGSILIWLGLVSFLTSININGAYYKILCLVFLITSGALFHIYSNFTFTRYLDSFSLPFLTVNKLFPIYIFLLCALLFFIRNKYYFGILSLLCLPIVTIVTAPGIFLSVMLFIFLHYIYIPVNKKELQKQYLSIDLTLAFSTVLLSLFILLFYVYLGGKTQTHYPSKLPELASGIPNIILIFKLIVATPIQLIILYFPIIPLFLFLITRVKIKDFITNHLFILFIPGIIIFSLICWILMSSLPGTPAVQVFSLITMSILNLSCIIIFLLFIKNSKSVFFYIGIVLIGIMLVPNYINFYKMHYGKEERYSDSFLKEVQSISPALSNYGAIMLDTNTYRTNTCSYFAGYTTTGNYLLYFADTYPISISVHDYPFSTDKKELQEEKFGMLSSPFFQYVEKQKQKNAFKNITQSRLDFISEFKINYLILTKDVKLDSTLSLKIKSEIRDSKSGERVLFLK